MAQPPAPFLVTLREKARARSCTLVFPEGTEPRVHSAVAEAIAERLFAPVLIGDPEEIRDGLLGVGLEPDAVTVLDPADPPTIDRATAELTEIRRARGASLDAVGAMARDPLVLGALRVRSGEVAGGVAGAVRTTADVVRAALTTIGLADGRRTVSSAFYMVFDADHPVGPCVLTFADAGVVPSPDARQLAEIGSSAATAHADVVGEEARVAFLSYSTKGSAEGAPVTLAREALEHFRSLRPGVASDGELQGDAALIPAVASRKAPGSPIEGRANVLIFPDLSSANIAYKLVQHLGGALALGPILQGLDRPFSDLSRGATVADIVNVACITATMACPAPGRGAGS